MSVKAAIASFEDLIKSLEGVASQFNITNVQVDYFVKNLATAGVQGLDAFQNNTKATLDAMFTYFNQFNENTEHSLMDEQTLMVQLIDQFRKEQHQKAIDEANKLFQDTRDAMNKAMADALAARGDIGGDQSGGLSVDRFGKTTSGGNAHGMSGGGSGSKTSATAYDFGSGLSRPNAELIAEILAQLRGGRP